MPDRVLWRHGEKEMGEKVRPDRQGIPIGPRGARAGVGAGIMAGAPGVCCVLSHITATRSGPT